MEEEVLQITYVVKGVEQGQALEAQLDRLRDARGRFVAAGSAEAAAEKAVEDQLGRTAARTRDLADATDRATKAGGAAGKGGMFDQQQIRGFSYALNDFFGVSGGLDQRLNAIANNLPMLLSGFGSLGLVLSGVVPIVAMLYKNWAPLAEIFNAGGVKDFATELDTLKGKIKELEDKPHKVAVDIQDLQIARAQVDEIKDALAAVEKLRKSQGHYEKESGAAIESMFAEAPGGAQGVHQKLGDQLLPEVLARVTGADADRGREAEREIADAEREAANLANAGQAGAAATVRGRIDGLKKEIEQLHDRRLAAVAAATAPGGDLDQEIGKVLDPAQKGAGGEQAAAQARLADLLRKSGQGDLARGVEAASPRQHQLNDEIDSELEAQLEEMKRARKAREEADKKREAAEKAALKGVQDFLDDEFDRDLKELKDGGKAGKAGAKDAQSDLAGEAKINEKAIDAEVGKIDRSVGKPRQAEYEARLAGDAAIRARGGPVARTAREDQAFRRAGGVAGVDYALPPGVLERQLRQQMAAEFRRRGAGEQAANLAAKGIGDKGNEDLARRMGQLNGMQGTNQARLITLSAALAGEMEHAVGVQVRHTMMIGEIARKVEATQRTGRVRGKGDGRN